MTAYEELVVKVAKTISGSGVTSPRSLSRAELALSDVLLTLESVTPKMWDSLPRRVLDYDEAYLAMLRASPLSPPKDGA